MRIDGEPSGCSMYDYSVETTNHILMHCNFTRAVYTSVPGITQSLQSFNSVPDWVKSWLFPAHGNRVRYEDWIVNAACTVWEV